MHAHAGQRQGECKHQISGKLLACQSQTACGPLTLDMPSTARLRPLPEGALAEVAGYALDSFEEAAEEGKGEDEVTG